MMDGASKFWGILLSKAGSLFMSENFFEGMGKCYVIAEIGVNHNGDIELAKQMISEARLCGADAVKFQTFSAEKLVSLNTPKVAYQEHTTRPDQSHFDMIKSLELSEEQHLILSNQCDELGIEFLSTPYDLDSAIFLDKIIGVPMFKTASADIVDLRLHQYLAKSKKPTMISVGMATLPEIEDVVELYMNAGNRNVVLLHCVSNYPCKPESLNLRVMETLRSTFKLPVGYSDHSEGNQAALMSVGFGAVVIEKHFTLDQTLPGPDHKASSTPGEFKALVQEVRLGETMLGSPIKECQAEEYQMSQVSRKSMYYQSDLTAGAVLEKQNIVLLRPGNGLPVKYEDFFLGKRLKGDVVKGNALSFEDVE
jgi:sialic acid synthase SpsE